jgi:hypothetical protein
MFSSIALEDPYTPALVPYTTCEVAAWSVFHDIVALVSVGFTMMLEIIARLPVAVVVDTEPSVIKSWSDDVARVFEASCDITL